MEKVKQIPNHEEYRGERMLLALSKVSQALQSTRSPEDVYLKFTESIHELGFEATILSLDDSGTYLTTAYQAREPKRMKRFSKMIGFSINDYRVPIRRDGILDQVVNSGRTVFLESRTEIFLEIFPKGFRSLISRMVEKDGKQMKSIIAPLRFEEKTFGVIGVSSVDLGENDMAAITVFAGQVSAALMNARAYLALQEQEKEKFRIIFEFAPDPYYISDLKGEFLDGNRATERITGYSKEELIGKSFLKLNLLPKIQLPTAAALLAENALGRPTGPDEFTLIRKDGCEIEVEISTHPVQIEGKLVVLGIARDITERKQAEQALIDSEYLLRESQEIALLGSYILDIPSGYWESSQILDDLFGIDEKYTKDIANWALIIHPDDRAMMQEYFATNVLKNQESFNKEYRIQRINDQQVLWVHGLGKLEISDDGIPIKMIGTIQDITERKDAEETLKRQLGELLILQEVSSICLENVDEHQIITQITKTIGNELYTDHFGVMLLDEEDNVLRIHPSYQSLESEDADYEIKLGEGVTGRVAKTNKPLRINDVTEEENYISPKHCQASELCVPISVNRKVFGVINAESSKPDAFTSEDERLLITVADQLAVALQKSRLYHSEQKRRLEAEANREASSFLTMSLDLDEVLDNILESLRKVIDSDQASIHLFEEDLVHVVAGKGFKNIDEVIGYKYSFENQLVLEIVNSKSPLVLEDTALDSRFQHYGPENPRAWMGIPLIEIETVFGYISVENNIPGTFNQRDAKLVQIFANNAAAAIVKARLFEGEKKRRLEAEIQGEISTALTDTYNLKTFLEKVLRNLQRYLNYDSAGILLEEDGHIRIVATLGFPEPDKINNLCISKDNQLYQEILKTKSVLILKDTEQDDRFEDISAEVDIRGWMGIPLIDRGVVYGYVSFDSKTPGKFTPEMGRLAQVLVNQTSSAIIKTKLFEETQLGLKRLEALHEIDRIITSSVELSFSIKQILQIVVSQLEIDAASLLLYDPKSLMFNTVNTVGLDNNSHNQNNHQVGIGPAAKVALERQIVVINNQDEFKNLFSNASSLIKEGFTAYAGVPLIAKGEIKGVLELFQRSSLQTNNEWKGFLQTLANQLAIAIDNSQMFENLQKSHMELMLSYDATIEGWAKTLELKDQETQGHSERVTLMTVKLARELGMSEEELIHVRRGAILHDVGKIGIPDKILQKPGQLTEDEMAVMREHPTLAYNVLSESVFLEKALDIPYSHHEKWDGTGYPRGIKEMEIPLAARVFAIIDVYDALRSNRPYRKAWSKRKTVKYINEQSGIHFDPRVVEVFLELVDTDPGFIVYD